MHMICFPWMHPEATPETARRGVRFLDPGLGDSRESESLWTPEGLPLDRKEAARYAKEALSFGERFQDHKELEYLRAAGLEDFFSGTSSSLSDELERRLKAQDGETGDTDGEQRKRGQMVLLLNWMLEDNALQAREGERQYNTMMSELRDTLGLEDSSEWQGLGFRNVSVSTGEGVSSHWSGIMPWFLLFLPGDGILFIEDGAIQAELRENCAEAVSLSEASGHEELKRFAGEGGLSGDILVDSGWRLALKSRPDQEMAWLNREYTVFLERG
ncbi:MAG: hypothetical protein V5B78_06765 [Desulfohalobiaceae bacterium]